jgi:protein-L-isoaspartate(D-aspartate) O-methyltransferase
MADFERARQIMVDTQIRPSDVTDRRILSVMGKVARELFVPEVRRELAYIDEMHPLLEPGSGRYLAAPAPFARLIQLASIRPTDKVLDVGCASGYSTAVLAGLADTVVGVEGHAELARIAREALAASGVANAEVIEARPESGVPDRAPFDVIIVEGTVERVPDSLFAQLAPEGRLVAVLRSGITAVAYLYVNTGKEVSGRAEFNASLPPLEVTRRPEEFVF